MTRPVGFYAHHHGGGHAARVGAIAGRVDAPVTVLTSSEEPFPCPTVRLPLDLDGIAAADELPRELHYAPLDSPGLSARMAAIAGWIAESRPALVVVDVSVEVTMLVRLCGVPVVGMRQHGNRRDRPHRAGLAWSRHLLAPFPRWFEEPTVDPEVRERTHYAGAVTRFDGVERPDPPPQGPPRRVLLAAGGDPDVAAFAEGLAAAAPSCELDVAASGGDPEIGLDRLADADVVVGACGSNLVAEASFALRPLVTWPRHRPFGEQASRGRLLERNLMAATVDSPPDPGDWPILFRRAQARAGALAKLADGGGARRAAAQLGEWARSSEEPSGDHAIVPSWASFDSQPSAGQKPHAR